MLLNTRGRSAFRSTKAQRNSPKNQRKITRAITEQLESRVLLSGVVGTVNINSYSTLVTDIRTTGATTSAAAYVNATASYGAGQIPQSFAVVEFDPGNATIYPGSSGVVATPGAPALAASTVGGSLAANTTYFVEYTWTDSAGESLPSTEASFKTGTGTTNSIPLVLSAAPGGTTGLNIYVGTSSHTETLDASVANPSETTSNFYTVTAPPAVGAKSAPNVTVSTNGATTIAAPTLLIAAPSAATIAAGTASGTLTSGATYYIETTWSNNSGETTTSTEQTFTATATGSINVTSPKTPTGATTFNVYVGTATGRETLYTSIAASPNATNLCTITAPSSASAVIPPSLNTAAIAGISTLTAGTVAGTLPTNTTYYVVITWANAAGETTVGTNTEASYTILGTAAFDSLTLTAPPAPSGTTKMNVYVGTGSGKEVFQGSLASPSTTANNVYNITTLPSPTNAAPPTVNTTTIALPAALTSLTTPTTGGSLAANTTYYVEYSWTTSAGQTTVSPESMVTTGSGTTNELVATAPAAPTGATGLKVYVGTSSGNETLDGSLTSVSTSTSNPITVTTVAPTAAAAPYATSATNTANLTSGSKAALAPATTGGSIAANTNVYVEFTYLSANGETSEGTEAVFTTQPGASTANSITIAPPYSTVPSGVTGYNVYVGTASGQEVLYNTGGALTSSVAYIQINTSSTSSTKTPPVFTTATTTTGTAVTAPTSLSLSLINNPDAFNSGTGANGNVATGSFDVYLLPTYTIPTGINLVYVTTATSPTLPLGLQGQAGLSGVNAANFLLGAFTPTTTGVINIPLTLPAPVTGSSAPTAETTLTNDLNTNAAFELAIVPATTTSAAEFEGEREIYTQANPASAPNGLGSDSQLDESPQLSLKVNSAAETFTLPYTTISVDQDNVSGVAEIDVQRNGYSGDAVNVTYKTTDGTGVSGTDYTGTTSGMISFAAGQNEAVISVPVIDTFGAPDKTFKVTLSSAVNTSGDNVPVTASTTAATVTIIGTANESDNIPSTTLLTPPVTGSPTNSFTLGSSAASVQLVKPTTSTYAAISGSVDNGSDQYGIQQFAVLSFSSYALQEGQLVTGLSSLSLELDNYNSLDGEPTDNNVTGDNYSVPNPEHYGNFNVSLLNSSATSSPTSGLAFEGADSAGGGINGQDSALLLGVASFSNQSTIGSTTSGGSLNLAEGVQDTYTLELSAAAQADLIAILNGTQTFSSSGSPTNSPGVIRLAISAGSPAFAAEFANNNSGTGGNFGIQPYLWLYGRTQAASLPPESVAINYSTLSVNSVNVNNDVLDTQGGAVAGSYWNPSSGAVNSVSVDIIRSATSYIGDALTVDFSISNGTAVEGVDYLDPTGNAIANQPGMYSVTIQPNQSVATVIIPIIPEPGLSSEKSFSIDLTGASASLDTSGAIFNTTATTITITPAIQPTQAVPSDNNGAAELNSTALFTGYAYVNGSVVNGTGSFAFQGYQVVEFQPSEFISPGEQLTSLTGLAIGLGDYENQYTTPGSNYGGPAGDFILYVAGDAESTLEMNGGFANSIANGGDPATYNPATPDGVGDYNPAVTGTVGPLSATTVGNASNDYAIPLGVVSFNTDLGLDYFTPTQEELNTQWPVPNASGTGTTMETPLQLIESQINAGENIRLLVAPGNSAFHAYFWGSNTGANSGGPNGPHLALVDTIATTQTEEGVGFGAAAYNVDTNAGSITVPVTRSILEDSGTGLGDTLTVNYAISNGNAILGTNYNAPSTGITGTLTFAPGVTVQNITIPIINFPDVLVNGVLTPSLGGDKAFTITLSKPATSNTTSYVTPALSPNGSTTVFITDNSNNAETLSQYDSSVGDIGTNGPVTFGISALNPSPPFNFSIFTGGRYSALDFNDNTVINYNDPSEFEGATGPNPGPYVGPSSEPSGIGPVTYSPTGDGAYYSSTISAINEISLSFVNYYNSTPGALLNVYLVADASSNILPGAQGTSRNPHFYDTTVTNINSFLGDGVGTQFGATTVLGTISYPALQSAVNFNGYTTVPLTSFNAAAEATLISDLNTGTKFRLVVAPETSNTAANADWIYGYVNANASYATATGIPLNFYINPYLSFDVSYASTQAPLPAYITPSANADYLWDPTTGNLTLTNGSLTFTSDGASDKTDLPVNLIATGPTTSVYFTSSQHLTGLTLSDGATAQVVSLGAARTHSNHSVLVIGTATQVAPPTFSIDSTSVLDLTDNDLIVHSGTGDTSGGENELTAIQGLVKIGRDGGAWDGLGLTSSAAESQDNFDGSETTQLGVVLNSDLSNPYTTWTVGSFSEPLNSNDIIVKYTYTGDFNLDGKVDFTDSLIFNGFYDNGASTNNEWAFGDTNGDGLLNFTDSLIFNGAYGNGTASSPFGGNDTALL